MKGLVEPWSASHEKLSDQVGQAQDDDGHVREQPGPRQPALLAAGEDVGERRVDEDEGQAAGRARVPAKAERSEFVSVLRFAFSHLRVRHINRTHPLLSLREQNYSSPFLLT